MKTKVYPGMIDSHFHSQEMIRKGLSPQRIIPSLFRLGAEALLDIATHPYDFSARLAFAKSNPRIFMAEGIHPCYVDEMGSDALPLIENQLKNKKVIALGEIGMDKFRNSENLTLQKDFFESQLLLANEHSLPIIIHNREADSEILSSIRKHPPAKGGILHCFSSDLSFARKLLDFGFYISFAGNLTYKKSYEIQSTAKYLPWNKILLETDSPYLAPMPYRGGVNHPGLLGHTLDFLAQLRGEHPVELSLMLRENFFRLMNLSEL